MSYTSLGKTVLPVLDASLGAECNQDSEEDTRILKSLLQAAVL